MDRCNEEKSKPAIGQKQSFILTGHVHHSLSHLEARVFLFVQKTIDASPDSLVGSLNVLLRGPPALKHRPHHWCESEVHHLQSSQPTHCKSSVISKEMRSHLGFTWLEIDRKLVSTSALYTYTAYVWGLCRLSQVQGSTDWHWGDWAQSHTDCLFLCLIFICRVVFFILFAFSFYWTQFGFMFIVHGKSRCNSAAANGDPHKRRATQKVAEQLCSSAWGAARRHGETPGGRRAVNRC